MKTAAGEKVRSYLCLCKAGIACFAALSAACVFSLTPSPGALWPPLVAGIFLLASGAGALNQFQERATDALMARTAGRPLPSGRVKPGHALGLSLLLIVSGSGLLWFTGPPAAPLLGLGALVWYNGFYTWLKGVSAFAALPGALVGAVPPAIGWVAGGGNLLDPQLAALCFFFFMWQIPHFFVHQLAFGREVEAIGHPALTTVFTGAQLERLTFQWLLAAAVSLQLVVVYGLVRSPLFQTALLAASLWPVVEGMLLLKGKNPGYPLVFRGINLFMLAVLLLFLLDHLPRHPG